VAPWDAKAANWPRAQTKASRSAGFLRALFSIFFCLGGIDVMSQISADATTKSIRVLFGQEQSYSVRQADSIEFRLKMPTFGPQYIEPVIEVPSAEIRSESGFDLVETEERLAGGLVNLCREHLFVLVALFV
jgi:hypothetical protein